MKVLGKMTQATKLKIKKGDQIVVVTGKNAGQSGEVVKVIPAKGQVLVQGVNMAKRHQRPTQLDPGGIKEKEVPLHISNVALADPKDGKPTRVGYKYLSDGRKVRYAKKSGEMIDS